MKKFIFLAFVIAFSMTAFSCVSTNEVQISYDKSVLQNVSKVTDDGTAKTDIAVSPDGNQLLYVEIDKSVNSYITNMKVSDDFYYYSSQMYLLRDISRPSKTPLGLTFSYWPAWNKNGKEFVFASLENNQFKLVRANIEGGRKTYITRTPIGSEDIRPDIKDNIILCQTKINGKNQIVTLNYDGTEITLICEGYSPSWHPRENKFVFISLNNIQFMLQELSDQNKWEIAELSYPFGNGINFQLEVSNIDNIYNNLVKNNYHITFPIEENWYRQGNRLLGNKEFLIQDPDGYLLRFFEDLGEK